MADGVNTLDRSEVFRSELRHAMDGYVVASAIYIGAVARVLAEFDDLPKDVLAEIAREEVEAGEKRIDALEAEREPPSPTQV